MTDNRYGDAPLGRSVEEIEQESGNRVNSPVQGEDLRDHGVAAALPTTANANQSSAPAVVNVDRLMEEGSGASDGSAQAQRDSSEENG